MKICFYTEGHIGDLLNPLPVILYNAYLSYFCKFIISRLSEPPMFSCMHTKNVSDPSKVLITQIHNDVELWYNKNIYRAENIRSTSTQNSLRYLISFFLHIFLHNE